MEIAVVRNERQRGIVNLRFRVGVLFLVVMEMILCRCLRRNIPRAGEDGTNAPGLAPGV